MTRPETTAARAGIGPPPGPDGVPLTPPIDIGAVRAFADVESLAEAMDFDPRVYRRYGSETVQALEQVLAALETPPGGVRPHVRAAASGQAALLLATGALSGGGRDRIVVTRPGYSGTEGLIRGPLGDLGVRCDTVDLDADPDAHGDQVAEVLDGDVAIVVAEVVTNPLPHCVDVAAIAQRCAAAGCPLLVDSTFTTPFLFQPFAHGATAVMHSLTKLMSGHSDVMAGAVLLRGDHPATARLEAWSRLAGAVLSPFDAWLTLRGIRTAGLRVERSSANAAALAAWFASQDGVAAVHYPGGGGASEERLCARLLPHGRGSMLAVDLGGAAAMRAFCAAADGIRLAPSLGDAATTLSPPTVTSHRSLDPAALRALGITAGTVRISVGIEAIDDLLEGFDAALAAAREAGARR